MSQPRPSAFFLHGTRRTHRNLVAGIAKVKAGAPFQVGSSTAHVSLNNFFARIFNEQKRSPYVNSVLSYVEEKEIVQKLLEMEHEEGFISFDAIQNVTSLFVESLPESRKKTIKLRNLRPTSTFCERFQRRHCYAIYCPKHSLSDKPVQGPLLTAEDVVTYFRDLKRIISEDSMYPEQIWSLSCKTEFVNVGQDINPIKFLTVFSVSNAFGKCVGCMAITHDTENLTTAVSSSTRFLRWINEVAGKIGSMNHRYQGEPRYHLLICDDSLSFVDANCRDWLAHHHIIVYSIPGLSGGQDWNHDVGCMGLWSKSFKEFTDQKDFLDYKPISAWTEQNLGSFVRLAKYAALTARNIGDSFSSAGIYPLDLIRFYKHPRPYSRDNRRICDMDSLRNLFEATLDE